MNSSLTDRYVNDNLSPAEVKEYELRLLEGPEMLDDLEDTLVLKKALKLDQARSHIYQNAGVPEIGSRPNWMQWALAASVVLLVFSSAFHLTSRNDNKFLKNLVTQLEQPRDNIIIATVKIMRSANNKVPGSIILLPNKNSTVLLEIELGSRSRAAQQLLFKLESEDKSINLTWSGSPDVGGYG